MKIQHKNSGEIFCTEVDSQPYFRKINGMYGYIVITKEDRVLFIYAEYEESILDITRCRYDDITSEFDIITN